MPIIRTCGTKGISLLMKYSEGKPFILEPRIFSSRDLFGDGKEVVIRHDQKVYRLLITRQGKLVLNK